MVWPPDNHCRFILASNSPRRRQLLCEAGYAFRVVVPPLEEPNEQGGSLSPAQQAEALAYYKARAVADQVGDELPILAADTVVTDGRRVFGKPADADDARRILGQLAGTRHQVITGVALLARGKRVIASQSTTVQMRPMTPAELDNYIRSNAWQGKAGAYGIQDQGDAFVERVEGSFSNVVGLPMELVVPLLDKAITEDDADRQGGEE